MHVSVPLLASNKPDSYMYIIFESEASFGHNRLKFGQVLQSIQGNFRRGMTRVPAIMPDHDAYRSYPSVA